jgi:hypothetical protein
MVELLYQQPFGAHAVESLEKQSAQKPLGWDARPAVPRVKLGQRPRLTGEHLINQRTDRTQRMIQRNPSFEVHVTEQLRWFLVDSAHRTPSQIARRESGVYGITLKSPRKQTFSAAC